MIRCVKRIAKSQRGFTLIELLVAVSIIGVIGGPLGMSVYAMMTSPGETSDHMTAVRQVERVVHEVTRDVQMAQEVTPDGGGTGFPLVLQWTDWEPDEAAKPDNKVEYTLENSSLKRKQSIGSALENTWEVVAEQTISAHINPDSDKTNCEYIDGVLTLMITADISGSGNAVESRVLKIVPRTNL